MLGWASRQARRRLGVELGEMAELNRLQDPDEIDAYYGARVHAWKEEYRAEGRAEGQAEGIEQGLERGLAAERELLCRQTGRKFDAGTADRLAGLLAPIGDTRRLAEVGDWIIDCTTGAELIARFGNGTGSGP